MFQILNFIATGMRTAPEFDVSPDPRTGEMDVGPAATLKINITDSPPDQRLPTIYHEGYYYSVNDTVWDRTTYIGVTQIAHRLGVSPATLYRYIPAARTANAPSG